MAVQVILTSGTVWDGALTDGSDIIVECIGGGGGGAGGANACGGGGGEYGKSVLAYFSGTPVAIQIGQGGTGGTPSGNGADGTATTFGGSQVIANGGKGGTTVGGAGGTGGGAFVLNDGGAGGGPIVSRGGGGGGGAGGPFGVGAAGGNNNTGPIDGGSGGGGNGNGTAGTSNPTEPNGGNGGLSTGSAHPGGAGATAGTSPSPGGTGIQGSGGGGGAGANSSGQTTSAGGAGGNGTEWNLTQGSGGGGGGGGGARSPATSLVGGNGGNGGLFGGGGGGGGFSTTNGSGGNGSNGVIAITYNPGVQNSFPLVQSQGFVGSVNIGGTSELTMSLPHHVTAGNLIVIACGAFFPSAFAATDNLGSTYQICARTDNTLGEQNSCLLYAFVQMSGDLVVTVTYGNSAGFQAYIAEYEGFNGSAYIQGAAGLGGLPATIIGPNRNAFRNGALQTSNTLIVSTITGDADSTKGKGFQTVQSDSGDAFLGYSCSIYVGTGLAFFQRVLTSSPGTTYVQLESASNVSGAGGASCSCAFTFSPLARPAKTSSQFGIMPGQGFEGGPQPAPSDGSVNTSNLDWTQKNLRTMLPYPVNSGALIVVALTQSTVDLVSTVTDTYGNTYTKVADYNTGGCQATLYYTIANNLPAAGKPFVVTAAMPASGSGVSYQAPGMVLAEYDIATTGSPSGAVLVSNSPSGGNYLLTTGSLTVPAHTILIAVSAVNSDGAGAGDGGLTWTAEESYAIRAQWTYAGVGFGTNQPLLAQLALMDKTVNTGGTYDAEMQIPISTTAGMALMSFTFLPLSVTCPPTTTATVGVPYSSSASAAGGLPPYTYSIIFGSLPPGLTLNPSSGTVTGTPTVSGNYPYTIQVTDSGGNTATASCAISIGAAGSCQGCSVWELRRVVVTLRPHQRMPVRGGSGS